MNTARRIPLALLPPADMALAYDDGHIPRLSPIFAEHVLEWLLAHPRR